MESANMTLPVVGIVLALGLWVSAVLALLRLQAAEVRRVPARWWENRDLADRYSALLSTGVRDYVSRHGFGWTIAFLVFFALASAAEFGAGFLLLLSAVLAMVWGIGELRRDWSEGEKAIKEAVGSPPDQDTWLQVRYGVLLVGEWLGFLSTLALAAHVAVEFVS